MKNFFTGWFTKKNLVWFFSMLVFLIICLEIFGRLYLTKVLHKSTDQKFRFNSYRIYEHVPGFTEGDENGNWIEINNQGFRRSTETTRFKPEKTFRIFLLGGSAAHGISTAPPYPLVHIYPNETIDFYLEKMLNEKYKDTDFEVINAAVTGYKTHQHTAYILSELLDYDPDLMIFYDGANDHYVNNSVYNLYLDNEYQFWKDRLQDPSFGGNFDYFMLWLSEVSAFSRGYLSWRMNRDADSPAGTNTRYVKQENEKLINNHKIAAKKTFLRSIETNISILKNNGVNCIITLQPMLVLRDEKLLSDDENKWLHEDENVKLLYPIVVDELKQLTNKHQVKFLDLNPAFNDEKYKSKQLFVDYCHISPLGGKTVAENLFPLVDSIFVSSTIK